MSKSRTKPDQLPELNDLEKILGTDQPEFWDIADPSDQTFWEEFFKIEDLLSVTDELDPPQFSITVQNHQTGEVKTYQNIHLSPSKKKILC